MNTRNHTKEKPYMIRFSFQNGEGNFGQNSDRVTYDQVRYILSFFLCVGVWGVCVCACIYPVTKNVSSMPKITFFDQMSAILKFNFQKKKATTFIQKKKKNPNYTKRHNFANDNYISLIQRETRTSTRAIYS